MFLVPLDICDELLAATVSVTEGGCTAQSVESWAHELSFWLCF